jgi:hypothetical protein
MAGIHAAGEKVSLLPGATGAHPKHANNTDDDVRQGQSGDTRRRWGAAGVGMVTGAALVLVVVLATYSTKTASAVDGFSGGGITGGRWGPARGLGGDARRSGRSGGSGASSALGQPMVVRTPALGESRNPVVRTEDRDSQEGREGEEGKSAQQQQQGGGGGGDSSSTAGDDAIAELKEAATRSGFLLPLTEKLVEKNPWLASAPRPADLLLYNVLNRGASALPDVAPGVPFSADDPEAGALYKC